MTKKKIEYNWSDAWLLLAVVYAGPDGATLARIIEVGDVINHAIFNPDELESGLARLTSGGYLKEKNGVFVATAKVRSAYTKTTSPRRAIHKEVEDMEKFIGAAQPMTAQPRANDLTYAGFSATAYAEAVAKYIQRFEKK